MLTMYGDFNCPFSALASLRADALLSGGAEIEWRAVQHDVTISTRGDRVDGELAVILESEVTTILEDYALDTDLQLAVPPVRPNTALASAYFAARGDDAHEFRHRVYRALWVEGRDIGDPSVLRELGGTSCDTNRARSWQEGFDALPRPVTPTVVRPDGQVSRGFGALVYLAELATR